MLSCFDFSAEMAKPWAAAGYVCYCVDMEHPAGESREGNIVKVGSRVQDWMPPLHDVVFASFFPPCTDVAVSGALHFKDKGLGKLIAALEMFKFSVDLGELLECPYMIENPVSMVSSFWRKPDYTFSPEEYGDPYTKKTCLWTGGGFIMPPKRPTDVKYHNVMIKLPPGRERARVRGITPTSFAWAVYESNKPRQVAVA